MNMIDTFLKKISNIKLFLAKISFINLGLLGLIVTFIWYIISPRLWMLNGALAISSLAIIRLIYIFIVAETVLLLYTIFTEKPTLMPSNARKKAFFYVYPSIKFMASLLKVPTDYIQISLVEINNTLVKAMLPKIKKDRILLLLPHCLQWFDCPYKITAHITNCRGCGKCVIADLIELSDRLGFDVSVATGGTIARRIVKETRPDVIIAVACERDLSSGILDTYPMPVLGIMNDRPEGPCINTQVNVGTVKEYIKLLRDEEG